MEIHENTIQLIQNRRLKWLLGASSWLSARLSSLIRSQGMRRTTLPLGLVLREVRVARLLGMLHRVLLPHEALLAHHTAQREALRVRKLP